MSERGELPGPLRTFAKVAAVLVFVVLVVALGLKISSNLDKQLIRVGEWVWPGYANELRMDPDEPDCDVEDLDRQIAECPDAAAAPVPGEAPTDADPFAGEDPFADDAPADAAPDADPFAGEDPFADEAPADAPPDAAPDADPFAGEDPFADDVPADPPADAPADAAPDADPFAGEDPFADDAPVAPEPGDPFAGEDPFAEDGGATPAAVVSSQECASLRSFRDTCAARWDQYDTIQSRLTPASRWYRALEVPIGDLGKFPYWKHLLVLLVMLGAVNTTIRRMPIALREARNATEHRLSQAAQLASHALLGASAIADFWVQVASEAENDAPEVALFWAVGFGVLAAINLIHLVRAQPAGTAAGSPLRAAMVVPLFAYMTLLSGIYFWLIAWYPSGQAGYLARFLQTPEVFLGIGLYLWAGMLFSVTRLATLVFGVLTPWKLPPALLAWLVVVLAAVPTAYSGASGIFVLAAGAVVFTQLRRAGATARLSLAATAMSGSLGVVLAPCLVVVLIAALNNDVTTAQLFDGGIWVFALTAVLALVGFMLRNKDPFKLPNWGEAFGGSGRSLWALVPFVAIAAVVVLLYRYGLGVLVTENTAMYVLPAVLLVLVIYDRALAPARLNGVALPEPEQGLWKPLVNATAESSDHIGALLMLMIGSIGIGDVIQRTDAMAMFPASLGGPWITMVVRGGGVVFVGMSLAALGAVVLVSISVVTLATEAGIHPVHFWLMVLVAFELGYLTPPVALNHLLARQVIGEPSHVEEDGTVGFFARNEHIVLPMAVMAVALVIVAFGGFYIWPPGG
ncbi:MAG: TRAP transporter large permease subunit [Myxococcota bacterium]